MALQALKSLYAVQAAMTIFAEHSTVENSATKMPTTHTLVRPPLTISGSTNASLHSEPSQTCTASEQSHRGAKLTVKTRARYASMTLSANRKTQALGAYRSHLSVGDVERGHRLHVQLLSMLGCRLLGVICPIEVFPGHTALRPRHVTPNDEVCAACKWPNCTSCQVIKCVKTSSSQVVCDIQPGVVLAAMQWK